MSDSQRQKIVQEVFQCFQKSIALVIEGRQSCQPTEDSINRPMGLVENPKYVAMVSRVAELDPYTPICLEIFYSSTDRASLVRVEKWLFALDKKIDPLIMKRGSIHTRRLNMLKRTLYCFARLLPAFYIHASSSVQLYYRLSSNDVTVESRRYHAAAVDHSYDDSVLSYRFASVPTPVGGVTMSVVYMDPNTVQAVAGAAMTGTRTVPPVNSFGSTPSPSQLGPNQTAGSQATPPIRVSGINPEQTQEVGYYPSHSHGHRRHSIATDCDYTGSNGVQKSQQGHTLSAAGEGSVESAAGSQTSSSPMPIPGREVPAAGRRRHSASIAIPSSHTQAQSQPRKSSGTGTSVGRTATPSGGYLDPGAAVSSSPLSDAGSSQHLKPPIGPSSLTSGGNVRRQSRTESFDDSLSQSIPVPAGPQSLTSGSPGQPPFCLQYSPTSNQDMNMSMKQPLKAYWSMNTASGNSKNPSGLSSSRPGVGSAGSQYIGSLTGHSLPKDSPPFSKCSPTLLDHPSTGHQLKSGSPMIPGYCAPGSALTPLAPVKPVLHQLLAKTEEILSDSNGFPPSEPSESKSVEALLPNFPVSPFDAPPPEREKGSSRSDNTQRGSFDKSFMNPSSVGRPSLGMIEEMNDSGDEGLSDSSSDLESDMPFAWVPDAAVEKSPPKTARKTPPGHSGMGPYSGQPFPMDIESATEVGEGTGLDSKQSLARQCANAPPLRSFTEPVTGYGSGLSYNMNQLGRKGYASDRKAILESLNSNYPTFLQQLGELSK